MIKVRPPSTNYIGRLVYGEQALCFDESELLWRGSMGAADDGTLESEARAWLEHERDQERRAGKDYGADYDIIEDPAWQAGHAAGLAEVLCALSWLCKGIHVSQGPGDNRPSLMPCSIDLTIPDQRHEIWIEVPDPPQIAPPPRPLALEDKRAEIAARAVDLRQEEGLGLVEAGERLGVPPSTLSGIVREAGPPKAMTAKQYAQRSKTRDRSAIHDEAQRLKGEGLPHREIAKRVGVPAGSVGYYLEPRPEAAIESELKRLPAMARRLAEDGWPSSQILERLRDKAMGLVPEVVLKEIAATQETGG